MKVFHPNMLAHLESVYLRSDSQTLRAAIPAHVPHAAEASIKAFCLKATLTLVRSPWGPSGTASFQPEKAWCQANLK